MLNVERQEFFLLNDTYLPSYPVSLEWLDFNPKSVDTPAHLAAVGYMMPEIHVWDLNKSECLDPLFTLGSKKQKKTLRHREAVMDLAWNTSARLPSINFSPVFSFCFCSWIIKLMCFFVIGMYWLVVLQIILLSFGTSVSVNQLQD